MPTVDTPIATLAYTHNGVVPEPGRPALVLVHGAGGRERDWPMAWRSRADYTRDMGLTPSGHAAELDTRPVYAVDLPGHGGSGGSGADTVAAYADAVAAFLDALDLGDAIVVGHSMGAGIALDLAARHNPRLAGIVLIGGAARLNVSDAILDGLQSHFEATVDAIVKYSWFKQTTAFFKQKGRQHIIETGQATVYGDFLACSRYDLSGRLGDVAVPALVIASDNDRMVPLEASRAVHDGLTDSRLVTLENCGHFQHIEQTAKCAEAISEFCRELD
jgi:pimeloyl-ACP methyl ester carboxylesterase